VCETIVKKQVLRGDHGGAFAEGERTPHLHRKGILGESIRGGELDTKVVETLFDGLLGKEQNRGNTVFGHHLLQRKLSGRLAGWRNPRVLGEGLPTNSDNSAISIKPRKKEGKTHFHREC